ncbi:MAG TPA: Uma2 family endonuclease [Thermoanaerobaculia bacterium]|jgi:Uma2 family endonuclease|nr:Uma2 family endonuclease [Thermoanaerobaculia bacterium]
MTELALRPATYEDLLKVPDNLIGELIDGELYVTPRPAIPHMNVISALGADLNIRFQRGSGGPGGWWILVETEAHVEGHGFVPDVAGWRRERLPVLPTAATIDIAPDWVCEVQSPSTARLDRVKKLPMYAEIGVRHVWLIDPPGQTLEVLRLENDRWMIAGNYGGDDVVRAEPFEAVEIELAALWIDPPAK